MTIHRLLICGIWAGLGLAFGAVAHAADWADAVNQVIAVPRHNQWTLIDPEQRPILKKVVEMPATARDELLRSSDARLRGIGIFVVDQQGDIAKLLSLKDLLTDNASTVPYAVPVAQVGEYVIRPQTVADYLTTAYQEWFGVDIDKSQERFDKLLGPLSAHPQDFVQPWIVRLRRAAPDEKAVAEVKRAIAALPEEVRWAVVTLGYSNSLYTRDEARAQLGALSAPLQARLRAHEEVLPNEPLFQSTSFRAAVQRVYQELSTG
jgi:hypothetical protein